MRILVVEDDLDLQRLYAKILQYGGYEVAVLGRGDDVLTTLQENLPDVLVLDVLLPGVDGREILTYIRNQPQGQAVKIVALSGDPRALDYPEMKLADEIIMKPLGMDELLELIAGLVTSAI